MISIGPCPFSELPRLTSRRGGDPDEVRLAALPPQASPQPAVPAASASPPLLGPLVGTREIGSSDALIDQGSQVIAGRLWLAASTEAQIAKDAVIEASEVLIHATADLGATHAQLRQGVQVWAGEMSMLSENDASIDKNVTVTVEGHFEMEAKGKCRIDKRATIVAGSTSGNCFE